MPEKRKYMCATDSLKQILTIMSRFACYGRGTLQKE